jgi:hypothetical protein
VTQLTERVGSTDPIFPSEGGSPIQDERAGVWGIAIGVGVGLVLVGEALMRVARSHTRD